MQNNDNGGNFNNTSEASPVSAGDSLDVDSVGSSANESPMSARDFLSRRQEIREKKAQAETRTAKMTKAQPKTDVAEGDGEEASDETDSSQLSTKESDKQDRKDKDRSNPKFQQRVDKLTAKYHEAERKAAQKDIQIEKLMKATEILQKELERVAKVAKLDPREERIKELEYQQEVEKFTNSLSNKEEELYSKSVSEYQVQTRADEILDEVNDLVAEYDLVSPEEILIAMRDRGMSAKQAARSLHNARLERASKKTVKHPATVSKSGAGGTNPVDQPYRGAASIKDFFLQRMAERDGKAK
jgi:hypothetical protein